MENMAKMEKVGKNGKMEKCEIESNDFTLGNPISS